MAAAMNEAKDNVNSQIHAVASVTEAAVAELANHSIAAASQATEDTNATVSAAQQAKAAVTQTNSATDQSFTAASIARNAHGMLT